MRNFKILLAAAMAIAAISAVSATAAQAANFHCSVEPCRFRARQDGTGKTAHQVFIVENTANPPTESVSFTCEEITGEGSNATKTSEKLTLENINYNKEKCTVNGSAGVEVVMNGCKYEFSAAGTVKIVGCATGKKIEVKISGCVFTIGEQGPLSKITYHNIGTGATREATVEVNVSPIVVTADGTTATCKINPNQTLVGTYTTGNAIATAETTAGVMAEGWWE